MLAATVGSATVGSTTVGSAAVDSDTDSSPQLMTKTRHEISNNDLNIVAP